MKVTNDKVAKLFVDDAHISFPTLYISFETSIPYCT